MVTTTTPTCDAALWDSPGQTGGTKLTDLEPLEFSVSLDTRRAPYALARLLIRLPGVATVDQLDPRVSSRRIRVTLSKAGVTRTYDLGLRGRSIDYLAGTVSIDLASDEALAQDRIYIPSPSDPNWSPATYPYYDFTGYSLRDFIQEIIFHDCRLGMYYATERSIDDPGATVPLGGSANASWNMSNVEVDIGGSFWDTMQTVIDGYNMRLWCDIDRSWYLNSKDTVASGLYVVDYDTNPAIEAGEDMSRDSDLWADAVLLRATWEVYDPATGDYEQRLRSDIYGPAKRYDQGNVHMVYDKGIVVDRTGKIKVAGAAANYARRMSDQGRVLELGVRMDLSVVPNSSVAATVRAGQRSEQGVISSVSHSWPEGVTRISTRGVVAGGVTTYIRTPAGTSWSDIPAGVTWSSYPSAAPTNPNTWARQPRGRGWNDIPAGTSWKEYQT